MENIFKVREPEEINEDVIFLFVVHGFAPEFSDGLVFRKDKAYKNRRMKDIICPYCGNYFEQVDINLKIEVFRCTKKTMADYHKSRPCKVCHKIVAIKYAL